MRSPRFSMDRYTPDTATSNEDVYLLHYKVGMRHIYNLLWQGRSMEDSSKSSPPGLPWHPRGKG